MIKKNNFFSSLNFEELVKRNQEFSEKYNNNALLKFIKTEAIKDKSTRARLLDCIQVLSDYFQKALMLRYVLGNQVDSINIAYQHLCEEFGHSFSLMKDRDFRVPVWDPILEATSSWFSWKMFNTSDEGRTLLIHLVLEASADAFFSEAIKMMQEFNETNYYTIHAEVDEQHEKMGLALLEGLSAQQYKSLFELQQQGWDMINVICTRIAELCSI